MNRALAVETWESLFRSQVSVMRSLASEFPMHGLTFNEYDILFTLSREPGNSARLRVINRRVLLSQPSVSRLVDRLTGRGLLEKRVDPGDKRGAIVTITEEGYRTFLAAAKTHMASIRRILHSSLTEAEMGQLRALTEKLRCPDTDTLPREDGEDPSP